MKQTLLAFILVLVLTSLGFATATSQDEQAVTNVVEFLRQAMLNANKADLEKISHDNLIYAHSGGRVENKAQFVDNIVTKGTEFKTLFFKDLAIQITDDVAVVRHVSESDLISRGKPNTVNLGVMLVFKKMANDWKLLARQAFALPQAK